MRTILLSTALVLTFLPVAHASEATPAARKLAQDAVIVDTHIDSPTELMKQWKDLGVAQSGEFDYPKARAGGLDVAFMSIYTSPGQDDDGSAWTSPTA